MGKNDSQSSRITNHCRNLTRYTPKPTGDSPKTSWTIITRLFIGREKIKEAADFLSRNALDAIKGKALDFVNYTKTEIRNFQRHDPTCEDIRSYLEDENYELPPTNRTMIERHRKRFVIDDDGILWWKESSNSAKLLIVPWEYTTDIISTAHDGLIGGHRDVEKTMDRIRRVYWWTTMTKDITEYVKCCETCQHQERAEVEESTETSVTTVEIAAKI